MIDSKKYLLKVRTADIKAVRNEMVPEVAQGTKAQKYCKANGFYCPECIYHEHVFEGVVFRGTRCRLESAE